MAALCFVFSSSTNEWHDNCPKGFPSWCEFKRDACKLNQIVQAGIIYPIHKPTNTSMSSLFLLRLLYSAAWIAKHKTQMNPSTQQNCLEKAP